MRIALVEARGEKSQAEISDKLNISQQYLSKIELGQRNPSVKIAYAFSNYYKKPLENLFPDIFLPVDTP